MPCATISSGVTGRCSDIGVMWIAPVSAQVTRIGAIGYQAVRGAWAALNASIAASRRPSISSSGASVKMSGGATGT